MLYELIKPYSSVSLIGMCKNAGKTTVLNRLIKDCRRMDESIALTSIGRDGERSDLVTNTKKPEIFVYDGTIIATAEKLLFAGGNLSDSVCAVPAVSRETIPEITKSKGNQTDLSQAEKLR